MTNFERIKNMTVIEMIDFVKNRKCACCAFYADCNNSLSDRNTICNHGIKEWMNQEVAE